jgi:hypothetical protein
MTTVLLVGLGAVGSRAARQLAETPDVELLVADRRGRRATTIADALGGTVRAVTDLSTKGMPATVDAVAAAVPAPVAVNWAARAIDAGVPVACCGDDGLDALHALDGPARAAGVTVAVGCGLAPGLTDVLAQHAAAAFDDVDDVHVARAGTAGPASLAARRAMSRGGAREWHTDGWRVIRNPGPELVWFPDPVGARECVTTGTGVELLVDAFPRLQRATVRQAPVDSRSPLTPMPADDPWGAARVELWGRRGNRREPVVYGVVEHTSVAAGTVLAQASAALGGALPLLAPRPGVAGLGVLVDAPAFLAELARRGVKAAVFEGVAAG